MVLINVPPQSGGALGDLPTIPLPLGSDRGPRVLITPVGHLDRYLGTLYQEAAFTESPVRDGLTKDELGMLLSLHPAGRAQFWGAAARYDRHFDQLVTGDVVLFTRRPHIWAVGRIGGRPLGDALWLNRSHPIPPDWRPHGSRPADLEPRPFRAPPSHWPNVYSVRDYGAYRSGSGPTFTDIRQETGCESTDFLQGTRVASPEQSAAIIDLILRKPAGLQIGQDSNPAEVAPVSGGTGQLAWTREEVILAMDFYVTGRAIGGGSLPGRRPSEVAQLSELLRKLGAYPPELQNETYRDMDGVYLKLMNLCYVDTDGRRGIKGIGEAEAAVWRDYIGNVDALYTEAIAIRQRLAEGILTPATATPTIDDVPVEDQHTERYMQNPSGEPREADRAEARLVHRYQAHLAAQGVAVSRKKYRAGQVRPMFCDLWIEDWRTLIEAKNSDRREALRMAIGQLYDYRRFHEPPVRLAVLLPHQPSPDGLTLLQSAGIEAIWPHGTGFRDSANSTFV
jgi:hypothetical protein